MKRMTDKENAYVLPQVSVGLRLEEEPPIYSSKPMDTPEKAVNAMKELLRDLDREVVCVCNLDTKLKPVNFHIVSVGSHNISIVEIGNVFKTSILAGNCHAILLMHNHPSGDVMPSDEDAFITRRVSQAGALLGIPLLDHVVVGRTTYSFRENRPDLFEDNYDEDYIKRMIRERAEEILNESSEQKAEGKTPPMAREAPTVAATIKTERFSKKIR